MRVLVVEDEIKVARFIERGLLEERCVVDVAADGNSGLELALTGHYDVIVLDVMLPGRDGMSVVRELRQRGCASRVLMLTALGSVSDRVRGLDSGADDYLPKPFAFDEFLARLRALVRRTDEAVSPQQRLSYADVVVDLEAQRASRAGRALALRPKELAVLAYLLRRPEQIVRRTQLARDVWKVRHDSYSNMIEVTVHHLREKLHQDGGAALIHTIRGVGYLLSETAPP